MPLGVFGPVFGSGVTPLNSTQTTGPISGATVFPAPANALGFLLQTDSTNATNVRYRIGGSAASASLGHQLEPGRDTGFLPFGSTLQAAVESGTCLIQLTWFIK